MWSTLFHYLGIVSLLLTVVACVVAYGLCVQSGRISREEEAAAWEEALRGSQSEGSQSEEEEREGA